jgi:hypothetical protein
MSDNIRLYLEGDGISREQLVRGQSIVLTYMVSPIGAERLSIKMTDKAELVLEKDAVDSGLGDCQLIRGWFPKLGIKGDGGIVISSQKGWFETVAGPKTQH